MTTFSWVIAVIVAVVVGYILVAYNSLVRLKNQMKEAWSDIDVQLKRRHSLIPNLVETVKGYATHEREAFESVTAARAKALGAQTPHDKAEAENMLSSTLKTIFAISENYPDLKANTNFLELQRELSDTENKIQASRRFYNGNVRDLNIAVDSFPASTIAGMFNFAKMEFFELEEGQEAAREPVKVQF